MSATIDQTLHRKHVAEALIQVIGRLAERGWTPATSSNFSCRLDEHSMLVTASGLDKSDLRSKDFVPVDLDGQPIGDPRRPSAETLLHAQIYRRFPDAGCVLHTHSHNQTVASRLFAKQGSMRFSGYELLKAFTGNPTHDTHVDLPVLPNSQDMALLAAQVEAELVSAEDGSVPVPGYLIEGHGLYAWGKDPTDAYRHLEAFEFLIGCELDLLRLRH